MIKAIHVVTENYDALIFSSNGTDCFTFGTKQPTLKPLGHSI